MTSAMRRSLLPLIACAVLGAAAPAWAQVLAAAVLPSSRSVVVNGAPATAFVTIVNAGPTAATAVGIALAAGAPAGIVFSYQQTNPTTNQPTGNPNAPANIAAGASQTYVISLLATQPFAPTTVPFTFQGSNTNAVPSLPGINTLLLSASAAPTPDIVALAATLGGNGIVDIPAVGSTGVFAVATVNVGSVGGAITAVADVGGATLPVSLSVCQTVPATGICINPPTQTVTTQIDPGATPTFAVFATGTGNVPFDPAANRVFVRFQDAGGLTRGSTSVAVRTALPNLIGNYTGTGQLTQSNCTVPFNNTTPNQPIQGAFTLNITNQTGASFSGTGTVSSGGVSFELGIGGTVTALGTIESSTMNFTVKFGGVPVGTGTANLTGQVTGSTLNFNFTGKYLTGETCDIVGSATGNRI